ncbi:MAG: radical SAM protein [Deferrisomatales bacterium]|nr:radical SAM protein [Deferrisomatales bacterium]
MSTTLRVSEIFDSIQGESHWAGYPCTFLRLAGCNLDCVWCDTRFARDPRAGAEWNVEVLAAEARNRALPTVEVTGGEPLLQPAAPELLAALLAGGQRVLLETNGSLPLDAVPAGVHIVMDLKPPGSGMAEHNRWANLGRLRPGDEVKIVCRDRADYAWARGVIGEYCLLRRTRVSLSAVAGELEAQELAAWLLEDRLDVRLQLQLHKVLWPEQERGV